MTLERGLVQEIGLKALTAGEGHVAVVEPGIKPVRDRPASFRSEARRIRPARVREVLGQGVARLERKALRKTAVRAKGDRIVVAASTVGFIGDVAESRIRSCRRGSHE